MADATNQSQSGKPAAKSAAKTKGLRIRSTVEGFRRGGVAHPKEPTEHPLDRFSKEQLQAIKEEPNLLVEEISLSGGKDADDEGGAQS